jgi:hypothetical protein
MLAVPPSQPESPRLRPDEYAARVWAVIRRAALRVGIPGYASLHAFTGAEEAAVKAALRGRSWTLVHPTNWRKTFPSRPGRQERVARETLAELRGWRPV